MAASLDDWLVTPSICQTFSLALLGYTDVYVTACNRLLDLLPSASALFFCLFVFGFFFFSSVYFQRQLLTSTVGELNHPSGLQFYFSIENLKQFIFPLVFLFPLLI